MRVGSVEVDVKKVGQGYRHEGIPPFHAINDDGDALCGAAVQQVFDEEWDNSLIAERCEDCLDLIP